MAIQVDKTPKISARIHIGHDLLRDIHITGRAIALTRMGFRPPTVAHALQISPVTARVIYRQVLARRPPGGACRGIGWLLRRITTRREASLAAVVYLSWMRAQGYVELPPANLDTVYAAHRYYRRLRAESLAQIEKPIDVSDMHTLVTALRARLVRMMYCCTCHAPFVVQPQGTAATCPFCAIAPTDASAGKTLSECA